MPKFELTQIEVLKTSSSLNKSKILNSNLNKSNKYHKLSNSQRFLNKKNVNIAALYFMYFSFKGKNNDAFAKLTIFDHSIKKYFTGFVKRKKFKKGASDQFYHVIPSRNFNEIIENNSLKRIARFFKYK